MWHEKRALQRFAIAIPAFVQASLHDLQSSGQRMVCRDVSSAGAYFHTRKPMNVGTDVVVKMILQARLPAKIKHKTAQVTLSGTVLRRETEGMAVRFDPHYKMFPVGK